MSEGPAGDRIARVTFDYRFPRDRYAAVGTVANQLRSTASLLAFALSAVESHPDASGGTRVFSPRTGTDVIEAAVREPRAGGEAPRRVTVAQLGVDRLVYGSPLEMALTVLAAGKDLAAWGASVVALVLGIRSLVRDVQDQPVGMSPAEATGTETLGPTSPIEPQGTATVGANGEFALEVRVAGGEVFVSVNGVAAPKVAVAISGSEPTVEVHISPA